MKVVEQNRYKADFKNALQISSAAACLAEYIITRNVKNYKKSPITALTPNNFIKKHL